VDQNKFLNKVALIFGGTSGIGKATAQAFAAQGADIVLVGRREQLGLAVVDLIEKAGRRGLFVPGDIAREEEVHQPIESAIREFKRIDIAFNNAGVEGRANKTDLESLRARYEGELVARFAERYPNPSPEQKGN
jgi:NAD(P)-dependent dehydrogenase (short-subunit alcohol dehydrogenase family)